VSWYVSLKIASSWDVGKQYISATQRLEYGFHCHLTITGCGYGPGHT
jgi:hypothetical protein